MWYFEWTPKLQARAGTMVPEEHEPKFKAARDAGYRSLYLFSEVDAQRIKAAGNSKNFDQFDVHSHTLYVDLDQGEAQYQRLEPFLKGIAHKVFFSGKKGIHVEIEALPLTGRHVPHSQKTLVQSWEVGADLSIYRHGGIIALEGRVHPDTKRKKVMLQACVGEKLVVPEKEMPAFKFKPVTGDDTLERSLIRLLQIIQHEPSQGDRHTQLWSISSTMSQAGLSIETAMELLSGINDTWQHPKSTQELERAIRQAYGIS